MKQTKPNERNSREVSSTFDEPLVEGRDFTIENGFYVFTRGYLLRRGSCCGSGCRNCPYPKQDEPK